MQAVLRSLQKCLAMASKFRGHHTRAFDAIHESLHVHLCMTAIASLQALRMLNTEYANRIMHLQRLRSEHDDTAGVEYAVGRFRQAMCHVCTCPHTCINILHRMHHPVYMLAIHAMPCIFVRMFSMLHHGHYHLHLWQSSIGHTGVCPASAIFGVMTVPVVSNLAKASPAGRQHTPVIRVCPCATAWSCSISVCCVSACVLLLVCSLLSQDALYVGVPASFCLPVQHLPSTSQAGTSVAEEKAACKSHQCICNTVSVLTKNPVAHRA